MPKDCNKILFCGDVDRLKEVSDFVDGLKNEGWVTVFSSPIYYEILPEGISKGETIKVLAGLVGIRIDGIMCIGDYYNDIEMLKVCAGGPCEDGAVADFVEYLEARYPI
jgi:hydroxymethylpyrimidine pyrophosphatase-like HAD family hydrolase